MNRMMKRFTLLTALLIVLSALAVTAWAEDVDDGSESTMKFISEAQLVVYVDGKWDGALSDSYGLGETVSLTAPEVSGKQFSHWTADGSTISYSNPLTLTVNAHTTLYAVYAAEAPAAASATGFTSITRINDGTEISFQARADGDVTEAGIVYSTSKTGADLIKGGTGVTTVTAVKPNGLPSTFPASVLDSNNCWMLRIKPENDETVYHARTYMTSGGNTIYGDVKDVTLSALESGYFLTVDPNSIDPNSFEEGSIAGTLADLAAKDGNGNGNNGNNNNSNSSTETKTITAPVTGDSGTVAVTTTLKGSDATIAPLTTEQVDSIVGSGSTATTVSIDVSNLGTEVKTVTIPAETVKAIEAVVSDKTKDADSLTVKLTEGSVTFDADAVKAIAAETKGDGLKVNLDDIGTEKLNTAQKSAVSDLTVETVLDAYVTSGSTRISDFKGGSATVSIKHTLKAAQSPAGIVVWYIADDGTRTQIPASFRGGEVVFTVTHFSNYVIAYDAEKAAAAGKLGAFTDLDSSAWYADGVLWALDNGVMNGWANPLDAGMLFGPNDTTTRAMVATMLWRLEGSPVVSGEMKFVDVAEGTWYTEAVRWAASVGIISGSKIPAETTPWPMGFRPNDAVTREQLAAMLYRYGQYKKADVSASADLGSFNDAASVSGWATSAMQWAVGSGIINGMDGNLVPAGNATRAQVATMLMRYSTAK